MVAAADRFDLPSPRNGSVENMAWSPDGALLAVLVLEASAGDAPEGSIHLLRTPSWDVERELLTPALPAETSLAWSPDSRRIVVGANDWVGEWDAGDGNERAQWDLDWELRGLSPSADQLLALVVSEADRQLDMRDLRSGWHRWVTLPQEATGVAWAGRSRSGRVGLILATESGFVLGDWRPNAIHTSPLPPGLVERPSWSHVWSRGDRLAVAVESVDGPDCYLSVWDENNDPLTVELELEPLGLFGASWSPDGSLIAATTGQEILYFDSTTLSVRSWADSFYAPVEPPVATTRDGGLVSLSTAGFTRSHAWSPDGRWFAAGNVGGIRVWDATRF
jgi:WD40 repeat protein